MSTASKPITKAKPIPFKLRKRHERILRKQARQQGKTMVRIVEECLEEKYCNLKAAA